MTHPHVLLDTELQVGPFQRHAQLLVQPKAAAALREACKATLNHFDGLDDARLVGTMMYVNHGFALEPRYVLITKPTVPFLQGVTLYVFPQWRGQGYAKALIREIQYQISGSTIQPPFEAAVRAADHPRLQRFYEELGFRCAGRSTDADGDAYFTYYWYPKPFEVFLKDDGTPGIQFEPPQG